MDNNSSFADSSATKIYDNPIIDNFFGDYRIIQTFSPDSNGIYYLGFYGYSHGNDTKELGFDDVLIRVAPQCSPPQFVRAEKIRSTSTDIYFGSVANSPTYEWKIVPFGDGPNSINAISGTVDTNYVALVDSLTPNTSYHIYIRACLLYTSPSPRDA